MNSNFKKISARPLGAILKVALVIVIAEFAIMVGIENFAHPALNFDPASLLWQFIDPALLTIIVAPVLYLAILRPMNNQAQLIEKQKEHLSAIFDTLSEGVALNEIIFNHAGEMVDYRILEVNKAFYRVADFVKNDPNRGQLATTLYGMDSAFILQFWETHKNATESTHAEMISPISGRHFSITTSPFINNRFVTSFQDITKRKRAEEKIAVSEARLSVLISTVDGVVWEADAQTFNFTFVSAQAERITGFTTEEWLTPGFWVKQLHPDDRLWAPDFCAECTLRMEPHEFEYRLIAKDGRTLWLRDLVTVVSQEGQPKWLRGLMVDITQHKLDEAHICRIQSNLIAAQKLARISFWEWDVLDNMAVWSDETYHLFGRNKHDLNEHRQDFLNLIVPADRDRVNRALSDALDGSRDYDIEYRVTLENGQTKTIHALAEIVRDADGTPLTMRGTVQDITEKKKTEERIEKLAHFDQLTGLPNRIVLKDHFKFALSLAQRRGEKLAVLFLDLDHFKDINDTLGHGIGDQLLMETSRRIKSLLREEDTVARQGGDEFTLILPGTHAEGATQVALKLIHALSQPCYIQSQELTITPSIGIAIYPDDGDNLEALSKNADTAMYRAKAEGRSTFRFFTAEMQTLSARNLQLANALRHALVRNELQLHYQPQLSIQDGHITGAEALLRWQHPELGMISPAEFIPIAEDSGLIIPIGEWVLRTALSQLKAWINEGLPPMVMAVNLSAVQFRQQNLPELVSAILHEIELPPESLELELTEAATIGNPQAAISMMNQLHEHGIRMSIDDFGTGYSSLSYLKQFKVYKLKIDQSFVREITIDPDDKAIVTAIISMAAGLGLQTIAEGVETAEQLAYLRLQGCNEVQGYYFSKPLPADKFREFSLTLK